MLGGLAYAAGIITSFRPASLDELIEAFDFDNVKRDAIFLPEQFDLNKR